MAREDSYLIHRQRMVNEQIRRRGISDERVLSVMTRVPRECFVPAGDAAAAFSDQALSIGHGQTISQPTTVMIMTSALDVREGQKILEVGAGSGYQAAILGLLTGEHGRVITTEIISGLVSFAQQNLKKEGIRNVEVVCSDGGAGYEKNAPYDRIMVTAACPKIPKPLIKQLKEGGILVAPVECQTGQILVRGIKKDGKLETQSLGYFRFVPLTGKYGYC